MSLFTTIRDFFIPHQSNGFRPPVLEVEYVSIAIIAVIVLKLFSLASFEQYLNADILNQISQTDLYALTNQTRAMNNLPPLTVSHQLEEVASLKLNDMVSHGYFAHTSPQGVTPWDWFDAAGYNYSVAGENLAMDFSSTNEVMNAWMNSPEHRANILLPQFTNIGIAVGSGVINGQQQTLVVEEFGEPVMVAAKPTVPAKTAPVPVAPVQAPTLATAFRSQPSQPIPAPTNVPSATPQVQGAQTISTASYFSAGVLNLIFIILALISIAIFLLNIFVAPQTQFPALIARSAILVSFCVLALLIKDPTIIGNHVILP